MSYTASHACLGENNALASKSNHLVFRAVNSNMIAAHLTIIGEAPLIQTLKIQDRNLVVQHIQDHRMLPRSVA